MIGDESVVGDLKKLLLDEEPNIRWDASIALAKLGDSSGINEILNLLDRSSVNPLSLARYLPILNCEEMP